MTFFGYFTVAVVILSLYWGYRIFLKFSEKNNKSGNKGGFLEKIFLIFFISAIMISVNIMAFVLSYSFFWEKAYRAFDEPKYEATVIGYKKEITKSKNFSASSYSDKIVFFPKVEYTDVDGKKVIKTLDITSDSPPGIGEKVKITDQKNKENTNALELDWGMCIGGGLFTGLAAFFATLMATYSTSYPMSKRIRWSMVSGLILVLINIFCVVFIYLK